jgi:hypothetical protein
MAKKDTPTETKLTKRGNRFTDAWLDATGNTVGKGAHVVATDDSVSGTVVSRWTNVKDGVRIPYVSVEPPLDAAGVAAVVGGRPRKTVGIAASALLVVAEDAKPALKPRARRAAAQPVAA